MKKQGQRQGHDQQLKRRLVLVRNTIRALSPADLAQAGGGDDEDPAVCSRTRKDD